MKHLAMAGGREFDRIRRFARALGERAAGWGDDAAVLAFRGPGKLVASTDLSIEGVHFRRAWLGPKEVGWRAAMAALSDLAAEGAEPLGLLVALGAGAAWDEKDVEAVMCGIGAAAEAAGTIVAGGDLSASERLVVACCALGRAERPVSRGGASAGDRVWVTGAFGAARAAVEAWEAGGEPPPAHRARFARPEARLAAGRWLARRGATAMIDVSDGLAADAAHVAAASGVHIVLDLDRLPLASGVADPLLAAASGEEYELVAALPAEFGEAEAAAAPVALTRIGRCETGTGVETRVGGRAVPPPSGYDHFDR